MNRALWAVQWLLAVLFLWAGGLKLMLPIILPGLTHIRPGLIPLAAAGLVIVMIGATVVTAMAMGPVIALIPFVTGLLAAIVAVGRWRFVPLRARTGRRERLQTSRPEEAVCDS